MKQDYTMYIYKLDRRTKTGERLVSTTVWTARTEAGMKREVKELVPLYPQSDYRFEYHPKMVTVKNLMTGKDIQIDRDTPWCCNPASETYWSM
jgi:outer membrane protein assembly factor BamD (BamD/ComL family)